MTITEFEHSGELSAFVVSSNNANIFIGRVRCLSICETMISSQEMGSEDVSLFLRYQSLQLESDHPLSDYGKQVLNYQERVVAILPCHTPIEHYRTAPFKS